jgi:hypothetical protein
MRHEVIVFDPDGELPEGKFFTQDAILAEAKRRGAVSLIVDPVAPLALRPFAKFSYGDGHAVQPSVPSYAGHAALHLLKGKAGVSWAAMFRFPKGTALRGLMRLVGDPSQAPFIAAPCADTTGNQQTLSTPRVSGDTWAVIAGYVPCLVSMDGVYAFALHGYASAPKLAWLAVAQSE